MCYVRQGVVLTTITSSPTKSQLTSSKAGGESQIFSDILADVLRQRGKSMNSGMDLLIPQTDDVRLWQHGC